MSEGQSAYDKYRLRYCPCDRVKSSPPDVGRGAVTAQTTKTSTSFEVLGRGRLRDNNLKPNISVRNA